MHTRAYTHFRSQFPHRNMVKKLLIWRCRCRLFLCANDCHIFMAFLFKFPIYWQQQTKEKNLYWHNRCTDQTNTCMETEVRRKRTNIRFHFIEFGHDNDWWNSCAEKHFSFGVGVCDAATSGGTKICEIAERYDHESHHISNSLMAKRVTKIWRVLCCCLCCRLSETDAMLNRCIHS